MSNYNLELTVIPRAISILILDSTIRRTTITIPDELIGEIREQYITIRTEYAQNQKKFDLGVLNTFDLAVSRETTSLKQLRDNFIDLFTKSAINPVESSKLDEKYISGLIAGALRIKELILSVS